ncbi:hypothetical protein D3C76_1622710 [compost metagenome]
MLHGDRRLPAQQAARVLDAWCTVLNVLISFAVVAAAFHVLETGKRREIAAQRMLIEAGQQHFRQLTNTGFVGRVADVDDLTIALTVAVFNNAVQRFNTIVDIGKATFLRPTVHQLDR